MDRAELERLDRDSLIARAEGAGVTRARILTRPELVDELLLRSAADHATKQKSRGMFGRARDLLASVVERGLNLPDAADRIRSLGSVPPGRPSAPSALPTVTLAEIYVAQGHRDRAIQTLERVLVREPDHAAASTLLEQLRDATYPVPPPRMTPEAEVDDRSARQAREEPHAAAAPPAPPAAATVSDAPGEPAHMLDDAPLPPRYDVDECIAIPVDPTTLYVYWEVREHTLEHVRAARPGGAVALRVVIVVPTWDGPRSTVRDHDVHASLGELFVRELPAGCVVRAAIGYRCGDAFVPIAHAAALETPPDAPSPLVASALVRWTPQGVVPVSTGDADAAAIERALGRARLEGAGRGEWGIGSSERWARA